MEFLDSGFTVLILIVLAFMVAPGYFLYWRHRRYNEKYEEVSAKLKNQIALEELHHHQVWDASSFGNLTKEPVALSHTIVLSSPETQGARIYITTLLPETVQRTINELERPEESEALWLGDAEGNYFYENGSVLGVVSDDNQGWLILIRLPGDDGATEAEAQRRREVWSIVAEQISLKTGSRNAQVIYADADTGEASN